MMLENNFDNNSQKLYGRSECQEVIYNFINNGIANKLELLTISGNSGIGKTSLIHNEEFYEKMKDYYFISGKFEKDSNGLVHSEFISPFRNLIEQLLGENDEKIIKLRRKLIRDLGENRGLLLSVIPELAGILEDSPIVQVSISPTETKNRFFYLFRSFVNIITLLDKPVVLFLDDIQWMNFECFELLKITIDTLKEHRFFLILSYRSEPVSVLNLVESKLKSSLNLINRQHVKLDFLSLSSIHSWLLDIVKQKCPDFISRLVQEETNGNPFIIKNFFRDLLAQRLFPFKNELSLTQWHIESEKFRLILRDTKFISNQFRSLPDDTKYLTKVILLYGKCCDLQTLHNILLHDVFEENLSVAVERGILLLSNKIYKIFHDKIAETILEQICDEEKADIHLKIGRYFIGRLDAGMITDDLEYFEMLKHFNLGTQNATEDELKRLIELNIEGVYKSKNLAAFNIALQFISWAKESLVYIDVMDHELKYRIYKEYIECSYLEKHNEQAEIALNDIFSSCNNFQKAELLKLKLHKEFIIGNLKGALEIGLKALKLLGVNISPSPNKLKLFFLDRVLRYQLSKISIRELADCPQMKNNDNLYLIIRILSEITPIVYNLGNKRLLTLLVLEQLTMLLKHGQVPEASYIYVLYGLILIMKKKYAEGYKFGSLAVDLVNKPENLPYKSRVYFVFAMFILPWNDSWNKSKFFFEEAIKVGLQTGDFYYAACSCYPINALSPSLDLKTEIQQADKYIQIAKKINISSASERAILYQFYRCSLYSKNSKSKFIRKYNFNEKRILEQANQGNMIHTSIGTYYLNKLKLAFYDQNHTLSLSLIQKINASSSYFLGHIRDFEFSFFSFLCYIDTHATYTKIKKLAILFYLLREYRKISKLSKNCPTNFSHHRALMAGELYNLFGIEIKASHWFNIAIEKSIESRQFIYEAIIKERVAKFYLKKDEDVAGLYLEKARLLYRKLGLNIKAGMIEDKNNELLAEFRKGLNLFEQTHQLNANSYSYEPSFLLKFITNVSSQSDSKKFLYGLMKSIMEASNAEYGCLALEANDGFSYYSSAKMNNLSFEYMDLKNISQEMLISEKIINYVKHAKKIATWDEKYPDNKFLHCPHIAKNRPKSIICIPALTGKNRLLGLIYLESNSKNMLLFQSKIAFLKILVTQSIIALQNTLSEDQRKVIAIGKVAAQVAHDIRSPLSALQVLTEQRLPELEESKRILLRDAVNHIRDIINNLDQKSVKKEKSITQVSVLLEHVLSERRTAFFEKPVKIIENITMESYSFFADIIQTEIKRVITNIINNAVEALPHQTGNVSINIHKQESQIIISITDDGSGIPQEVLNSLFSRGFTTKKTGSGLGLFHAKETLMQLGGDIDITSEVGKGTTVFLKIPACERPDWFIHALNVPDNSMVVCVDDSVSIWNAWQERFREFQNNIQLHYCANKEELLLTLAKQTEKPYIYLVDYEFSGKTYTGLDLIKKIMSFKKEEDKVYLVTSRSGEESLQKFCFEYGIYMIPKFFALKIPIKVMN